MTGIKVVVYDIILDLVTGSAFNCLEKKRQVGDRTIILEHVWISVGFLDERGDKSTF